MTTFVIPKNYGYVVLAVGFIGFVQSCQMFSVMSQRKYFKSTAFLENPEVKALQIEHQKYFKGKINEHGYPDMGNGRYSQLMPYENWVTFNNAQRVHYNMVESSAPVLACIITAGLFHPLTCAIIGGIYALSRLAYSVGYQSKAGADGRFLGAVTSLLTTFVLYGVTIYTGLQAAGVVEVITNAIANATNK